MQADGHGSMGSPLSGKTTVSVKLAHYLANCKKNVILGLPVLPYDMEILEKRFSRLTGKRLEDIGFDSIIMAPEMIKGLEETEKCHDFLTIYAVTEDWAANGERGHNETLYADPDAAKYMFNNRLKKELAEGCLGHWKDKDDFRVESARDLYEEYLGGRYGENHYAIRIEEKKLAERSY